jgi:hypothetical protein
MAQLAPVKAGGGNEKGVAVATSLMTGCYPSVVRGTNRTEIEKITSRGDRPPSFCEGGRPAWKLIILSCFSG